MSAICPDCGVSLDEVPFKRCRYHTAFAADEERAAQYAYEALPISDKIKLCETFEDLRYLLAEHFSE